MQFNDEKDYIMRMIKEVTRVLFTLLLRKDYVQVELPEENKCRVSGKKLNEFKDMVDRGEMNEAENILLEHIDYHNEEEVAAAVRFYQYVGEKKEDFLRAHDYSKEEVLEGLKQLAEKAGYGEVLDIIE